jgi:hypothetical protein
VTAVSTFESAAHSVADLVRRIPGDSWDGPGLGDWDLRSLVGHASRSLITVSTYLQTRAEREDIATPQQYYMWTAEYMTNAGAQAITERGRQAGRDLGPDPVRAIDELIVRALDDVASAGDPPIEVIDPDLRACRPRAGHRTGDGTLARGTRCCAGRGDRTRDPRRCGDRPRR